MNRIEIRDGGVEFSLYGEMVRIEPWGEDSLRVRATRLHEFTAENWALTEKTPECKLEITSVSGKDFPVLDGEDVLQDIHPLHGTLIRNGKMVAAVSDAGVLTFLRYEDGKYAKLLQEQDRSYEGAMGYSTRALRLRSREWRGIMGGTEHSLTVNFEASAGEKLYGMGQYQQKPLNLKGCVLELAQKNSQISVPFAISSKGYGFLWNRPCVGRVCFGENRTEWHADSLLEMDYWITTAPTPREILQNYTAVTGHAGHMPDELLGLWQCKLRYRTQDEVLEVARRYKASGITLSRIVIDFFHWTLQGDWTFDSLYWPDPKAMVDELHEMGTQVIVSVWPSVDKRSVNFQPMLEQGLLMKTDRGALQTYEFQGDCVEIDIFNPKAQEYVWNVCKKNYYDLGFDGFWLDNIEPDMNVYDLDNIRYYAGPGLRVSNAYPQVLSKDFYEHMKAAGTKDVCNLVRCCWAGSQKYGNVVWSGDIPSSFESLAEQIQCGLNMGLAGIPWWTTDIGGFMTRDVRDPDFRELLIRWYQFATYSPILRMHGDRGPHDIPQLDDRDYGGGSLFTGHSNEIWSYGKDVEDILRAYYAIRDTMRPYIASLYEEASENGSPLLRAMFYEFPEDPVCWDIADQYMFGPHYLVAPILHLHETRRSVYLPAGKWTLTADGSKYEGEQKMEVDAPLAYMPVFERDGK